MGVYQEVPDVTVQAVVVGTDLRAVLPQVLYDRKCSRINVNGPQGATLSVYKSMVSPQTRVDSTSRGSSNTADYSGGPLLVQRGGTLIVVWPGGALLPNPVADATFYFNVGGM